MNHYTDFEKKIIHLISEIPLDSNETFFRILQEKHFTKKENLGLIIMHNVEQAFLYLSLNNFRNKKKRIVAIKEFWTLLSLLNELKKHRFIQSFNIKEESINEIIYEKFDNPKMNEDGTILILNNEGDSIILDQLDIVLDFKGETIMCGFKISEFYDEIKKWSGSVIFPTQSLHHLILNNYRPSEVVRFEKQNKLTKFGLWLSLLIGLYGVGFNTYNEFNRAKLDKSIQIKFQPYSKTHNSFKGKAKLKTENKNTYGHGENDTLETNPINSNINSILP